MQGKYVCMCPMYVQGSFLVLGCEQPRIRPGEHRGALALGISATDSVPRLKPMPLCVETSESIQARDMTPRKTNASDLPATNVLSGNAETFSIRCYSWKVPPTVTRCPRHLGMHHSRQGRPSKSCCCVVVRIVPSMIHPGYASHRPWLAC
jgi:hypothetical protein